MEVTEMDKISALTFATILFKDGNVITRCGLGGSGLVTVRFSREVLKFKKYVEKNYENVVMVEIYKSTYANEKMFIKYAANLIETYENGVWVKAKNANPTHFTGKKLGSEW